VSASGGGNAGPGLPSVDVEVDEARLTIWVQGRVQGVGFRWWVRSGALELDLVGVAENLVDGRVKIIAEGSRDGCAALLSRLEGTQTPGRVAQVTFRWDQVRGGLAGFVEK
jgi:acylphosphatase